MSGNSAPLRLLVEEDRIQAARALHRRFGQVDPIRNCADDFRRRAALKVHRHSAQKSPKVIPPSQNGRMSGGELVRFLLFFLNFQNDPVSVSSSEERDTFQDLPRLTQVSSAVYNEVWSLGLVPRLTARVLEAIFVVHFGQMTR